MNVSTLLKKKDMWHPDQPYQDLPLLPPTADLETKEILKKCIESRAAVAELKAAAELIPSQAMLISLLPKLEAQASSEIENIVTTTDRLFQYADPTESVDPATKEALRYSQALLSGFSALSKRPLNTRTAEEVCSIVKGVEMKIRRVPGTQLINDKTQRVIYTPPVNEDHLRKLLANWEDFLNQTPEIDPLIRMAVGHYQFEAIHPFTDGNGRTGRIINSLFLIQEGLLGLPILYLSRYLIRNRSRYYQLLLDVTRNDDWEGWVVFILEGVRETSQWTRLKIDAIRKLMAHTSEYVQKAARKTYSHELLSLIFELPYCRIQNLSVRGIAQRQSGSKYLKKLVEIEVLEERTVGREKLFIHPKLLKLLSGDSNEFALYPTR